MLSDGEKIMKDKNIKQNKTFTDKLHKLYIECRK